MAHGNMRSARCLYCQCKADEEEFKKSINKGEIYYCMACNGHLVKPDIVFYGEELPDNFVPSLKNIEQADLVFIMGTSLKVTPFNSIVQLIPPACPVVMINRENSGFHHQKFLFIEGDIDKSLQVIIESCGWKEELDQIKKEFSVKH